MTHAIGWPIFIGFCFGLAACLAINGGHPDGVAALVGSGAAAMVGVIINGLNAILRNLDVLIHTTERLKR